MVWFQHKRMAVTWGRCVTMTLQFVLRNKQAIRQIAELRFQVGRLQTALFEALDDKLDVSRAYKPGALMSSVMFKRLKPLSLNGFGALSIVPVPVAFA